MLGESFSYAAPADLFETLFNRALTHPELLQGAGSEREGLAQLYDYHVTKAIAPRVKPSSRPISESAIKLIILFEVTGQVAYERKYRNPVWPGGQSGVTVGIGYDLGYVTYEWLKSDWEGYLSTDQTESLKGACGLRGDAAHRSIRDFSAVSIPWDQAQSQFKSNLIPRYVGETLARLPNAEKLSNDSLGAMVSLVYNRGASFKVEKDRYREMRAIRGYMETEQYDLIPGQIRKMKRLWAGKKNMQGLLTRRDLEADLFERGLSRDNA